MSAEVTRTLAAERRRKNLMKPSQVQLSVGDKAFKWAVLCDGKKVTPELHLSNPLFSVIFNYNGRVFA